MNGDWRKKIADYMMRDNVEKMLDVFNKSEVNVASDWVLAVVFEGRHDTLKYKPAAAVCTVDGLFRTNIVRSGDQELHSLINRLRNRVDDIVRDLTNLPSDGLDEKTADKMCEFANKWLVEICTGTSKRHYSFGSKILHWTTRSHFPMMDKRARKAINGLQTEAQVPRTGRIRASWDGDNESMIEDYRKWIHFCAELISDLPLEFAAGLLKHDRATLQQEFHGVYAIPRGNTLLRVLDKYLYMKGG